VIVTTVTSTTTTTATSTPKPDKATVPNVPGVTIAKARARLKGETFKVVVHKEYSNKPVGTVITTSVHAGRDLAVGTPITITVAKKIPRVPNVIGLSAPAATAKLKAADYKVVITKKESSQPTGHVISTNPPRYTERLPGETVVIVVAKPIPTPPVGGGGCNPNYGGCVPNASDVDCAGGSGNGPAYVSGPVQVIGSDVYGLDADGDGVGCE
jgi:beta-lactam-binding protein with PASTA domain